MNITSRTTEYILLLTIALGVFSVALAEETYLVSRLFLMLSTIRFDSTTKIGIRFPTQKLLSLPFVKTEVRTVLPKMVSPSTQYNVPNDIGVRVQRFEIQDHYHYIVEGEIANTLSELSARLALAYESRIGA
jgi:hypothetical protein